MIKIYTNKKFLNDSNRKRIFPLLFDMHYCQNTKTLESFCFTDSLEDAAIAVFPIDIISYLREDNEQYFQFWINEVSKYKIEIWVYAAGDFGTDLKEEKITTFRFGGYHSKMGLNTEVMPAFINDPYDEIITDDFFTLPKNLIPNIGFVGNANGSLVKFAKEYFLYLRRNFRNWIGDVVEDCHVFYPSSYKRFIVLQKMEKSKKLECNFIFRKKYRGLDKNAGTRKDSTIEFFNNIQSNLYVFCLRGNGNFSIRFYEALIMGRIPVLIDTDVRLPLSNEINWSQHCLLVSEDSITEDLTKFHFSKTDAELKEIQLSNRKLMLEKLNRIYYFIHFKEKFKK